MQITKLQPIGKNRYIVFLDDVIAFVLYKGDLRHLGIKEGEELSQNAYDHIMGEVLPERARARILYLLDKMDYTEMQLRRKLQEGRYPGEVIDIAVTRAKNDRYIDDAYYTRRYVECKLQKKSKRQIYLELQNKGIKKEVIDTAFLELEEDGQVSNEVLIAVNLLKKRHYDHLLADEKEKAKQIRYLLSKGISYENASKAMNVICEEQLG